MVVLNKNVEVIDLGGGVTRKILAHDGGMMAVEVSFQKGSIGALHTHEHEQICYVLEGSFELTIGDEKMVIHQGDTYYTKPNLEHGVLALEDGKLLDIFTPQREDFLK